MMEHPCNPILSYLLKYGFEIADPATEEQPNDPPYIAFPRYIKTENGHCVVRWLDGSVTHVPVSQQDSRYSGFCAALVKRFYSHEKPFGHFRASTAIEQHGDDTLVFWDDGTHTTVKVSQNDTRDQAAAFNAAYAKKIFGSNSAVHRVVNERSVEYLNAKKAEEKRANQLRQQAEAKAAHARKVKRLARELLLMDEAIAQYEALRNKKED